MPLPRPAPTACTVAAVTLALAAAAPAGAQPAAASAPAMPYTRVAEALKELQARDGNGTIVTHAEGWTTVNEPALGAQWSFTPADHEAYPALVRRTILRGPGNALSVDTALLCEAPAEACARLKAQFEAMNDRIVQALKARGRGGSTPPMPTQ